MKGKGVACARNLQFVLLNYFVDFFDFFKLSPSSVTRGLAYKLYKPDSTSAARSHFLHAE